MKQLDPVTEITLILHKQIGRGESSEVYRATFGDQVVAVKLFAPYTASRYERSLRQFETVAQILPRLDHPRIPKLIGTCTLADGRDGIILQLIEGEELAYRLERRPMDESEIIRLGIDLCATVAYVHSQGVTMADCVPPRILGDVARGNVLLTPNGACLVDFGDACLDYPTPQIEQIEIAALLLNCMLPHEWTYTCPLATALQAVQVRPAVRAVLALALQSLYPDVANFGAELEAVA